LRKNFFFEGVEEFVEFKELFVHVDGGCLELLDFLGAVGEDDDWVGRRWRELRGAFFAVEDVVDVDADGFEFFAENVADGGFAGDVGGGASVRLLRRMIRSGMRL